MTISPPCFPCASRDLCGLSPLFSQGKHDYFYVASYRTPHLRASAVKPFKPCHKRNFVLLYSPNIVIKMPCDIAEAAKERTKGKPNKNKGVTPTPLDILITNKKEYHHQ
jgi:hypothetical protein